MTRFLPFLPVVVLILVAACAQQTITSPDLWDKPEATRLDFAQDRDHCLRGSIVSEIRQEEFGGSRKVHRVDREVFRACMNSRGCKIRR